MFHFCIANIRLYHGLHTGIADGEAFAHPSVDIYLAVSSAIQQGVSGDGILFRIEIAAHGGQYRNASAAQSFSQVVIRFAFQLETAARMLADCPRLREQEESKISIITTGFRAYVCTR